MSTDEMLDILLSALRAESRAAADITLPADTAGKWHLLRALMNIRPPMPVSPGLLEVQDRLLSARREGRGVTRLQALRSIRMEYPGTQMPFAECKRRRETRPGTPQEGRTLAD